MPRDKLLKAIDNNCIEKKTITFFIWQMAQDRWTLNMKNVGWVRPPLYI